METLETSETLIEGLEASKQYGTQNPVGETCQGGLKSFDLGKGKCAVPVSEPVPEGGHIESVNVEGCVTGSHAVASVVEFGNGVDLGSHGDVPVKGISLFVQLTGGVKSDASHGLEGHGRNRGNVGGESLQGEDIVGQQECLVNVGDFVWAMTKNQSWWPGIICDASSAPKNAVKVQKREDSLLVRCFGNGSYVWCLPSQLKPFIGCFDQFSKQSNSKSFVGALEKAVAELGRRVKTEFTCSCFSKKVEERSGDVGDLSVTQFDPATFVEYIKDFAREISMPSKIDYTMNQNRLSAFYRSLGHCQIPVHQLKSANDAKDSSKMELTPGTVMKIKTEEGNGLFNGDTNTEDNKGFTMGNGKKSSVGKSEKPYETRERRKSKFLSYPYINSGPKVSPVTGEQATEELKTDLDGGVDLNNTSVQSVKKPRKKWTRKPLTKHGISGKGAEASVCSSEVLSDLRCAALDCLFPNESKRFDSVERFISRFRKWAFNDFTSEITIECTVGQESGHELRPPEIGVQSEKGVGMENTIGVNTTAEMAGIDAQGQPLPNSLPKRGRKKKDKVVSSPMTINITNSGPMIIDFQNVGALAPEAQSVANKGNEVRNEEIANQGLQRMEAVSGLNGNCTILNFGYPLVTEPPPCKLVPKRRKKNEKGDTSMLTWNSNVTGLPNVNGNMGPFPIHTIPQQNDGDPLVTEPPPCKLVPKRRKKNEQGNTSMLTWNSNVIGLPNVNGNVGPFSIHAIPQQNDGNPFTVNNGEPQSGIFSAGVNLEPKKRGRKRKNVDSETNSGSTMIPDLNGNDAENKPQKKTGRKNQKKVEIGVPCIDLSYNKVQHADGEVTGTAFLLKFSPDYPLPSNEILNSVFCKYGALNESETQVLNENLSGQVVFLDSSSAGEAFRSLGTDSPFGPALVNYRVQHLSGEQATSLFKTPIKIPSGLRPPQQGESMSSQASIGSTMILNLTGNGAENLPQKKKGRKRKEVGVPCIDLNYNKVQKDNVEVTGTALLLKFSPDHPLPSNEVLNSVFCKYGSLNQFETQVSNENLSGQVVFLDSSSAVEAFRGLGKDKPFGQALVNYRVQHLSGAQAAGGFMTPIKIPLGVKPPQPDLAIIRKNLEMMTAMLEKSGDSLSPEMRAKLEREIKGLMNKVSTMDGSSNPSQ